MTVLVDLWDGRKKQDVGFGSAPTLSLNFRSAKSNVQN
jgi:hypothetical protein